MKIFYVYILASCYQGALYIGVTSDIIRRSYEHRTGMIEGFTKKYFIHKLVYYEEVGDAPTAIKREKQLKKWKREWKINLIEKNNPQWTDLYLTLVG